MLANIVLIALVEKLEVELEESRYKPSRPRHRALLQEVVLQHVKVVPDSHTITHMTIIALEYGQHLLCERSVEFLD